jgi:hypothetical protein
MQQVASNDGESHEFVESLGRKWCYELGEDFVPSR